MVSGAGAPEYSSAVTSMEVTTPSAYRHTTANEPGFKSVDDATKEKTESPGIKGAKSAELWAKFAQPRSSRCIPSLAALSTQKDIQNLFQPRGSTVISRSSSAVSLSSPAKSARSDFHVGVDASDSSEPSTGNGQSRKSGRRSAKQAKSAKSSQSLTNRKAISCLISSDESDVTSVDSPEASSDEADDSDATSSAPLESTFSFRFITGCDEVGDSPAAPSPKGTSELSSDDQDNEVKPIDLPTAPHERSKPTLDNSTASLESSIPLAELTRLETPTYINELLEQPSHTTASVRLLHIMRDEKVKLDSTLGLKLLDLVQAMKGGGELSPIDVDVPVPQPTKLVVDIGYFAKLQVAAYNKTSDRLNEFAGMLNAIAEAVGVNLREDGDKEDDSKGPASAPVKTPEAEEVASPPAAAETANAVPGSASEELKGGNSEAPRDTGKPTPYAPAAKEEPKLETYPAEEHKLPAWSAGPQSVDGHRMFPTYLRPDMTQGSATGDDNAARQHLPSTAPAHPYMVNGHYYSHGGSIPLPFGHHLGPPTSYSTMRASDYSSIPLGHDSYWRATSDTGAPPGREQRPQEGSTHYWYDRAQAHPYHPYLPYQCFGSQRPLDQHQTFPFGMMSPIQMTPAYYDGMMRPPLQP